MLINKVRNYIGEFRAYNKERRQVVQAAVVEKKGRLTGRIVRYVHSIEKGLSVESPRAGFGYEKIKTLYGWIEEYLAMEDVDKTCIYMAADALAAYCAYHDSIGVTSEQLDEIKAITAKLTKIKDADNIEDVFGGVLTLKKADLAVDQNVVENLFKTRHSIRQFENKPVSNALIEKAVALAQSAPSACNRQAVRAYAIDVDKFKETYPENLQGVGGFLESGDKVLIITGKISPYEESEYKQFVVSAGIFAGYLSLALHGLGLGACIVQRSIRPHKAWFEFRKKHNIPEDEQVICLLIVGNMREETIVPLSKRFDTGTILRWL